MSKIRKSPFPEFEEYNKAMQKAIDKNEEIGYGFLVGKVFRFNVADGYAWYELTKLTARTVTLKWRNDLCPDEYRYELLGMGGSFPRKMIEDVCMAHENFERAMKGEPVEREQEYTFADQHQSG